MGEGNASDIASSDGVIELGTNLRDHLSPYLGPFEPIENRLQPAQLLRLFADPRCFTGGRFDTLGRPPRLRSTVEAEDLLAVSMLSIEIRFGSRSGISTRIAGELLDRRDGLAMLLAELDHSVGGVAELERLDWPRFSAAMLGEHSPGHRLWAALHRDGGPASVGLPPVAANKLLARLRPGLFPVVDSSVREALQVNTGTWWRSWWAALQDGELVSDLSTIRAEADRPTLSLLRVADTLVWMRKWAEKSPSDDVETPQRVSDSAWREATGWTGPDVRLERAILG